MRAVVTGAGRGIGAAISDLLVRDGYEVVRLDVAGADDVIRCDIGDADQIVKVAESVGPVDVLVNNAAIWRFGPLEDVSIADFNDVLRVNLVGAFVCTQAFGRSMLERRKGSIVNIASIAAPNADPLLGAYSPSKAAIVALTRLTALEWGPRGVRCNAVGPGFIPTPGSGHFYDDPDASRSREEMVPLRRLGTPQDIAEVVAFLASDRSSYVTGQTIYVDGGINEGLMGLIARPASGVGAGSPESGPAPRQ